MRTTHAELLCARSPIVAQRSSRQRGGPFALRRMRLTERAGYRQCPWIIRPKPKDRTTCARAHSVSSNRYSHLTPIGADRAKLLVGGRDMSTGRVGGVQGRFGSPCHLPKCRACETSHNAIPVPPPHAALPIGRQYVKVLGLSARTDPLTPSPTPQRQLGELGAWRRPVLDEGAITRCLAAVRPFCCEGTGGTQLLVQPR